MLSLLFSGDFMGWLVSIVLYALFEM